VLLLCRAFGRRYEELEPNAIVPGFGRGIARFRGSE
jgi:hypothetical protein